LRRDLFRLLLSGAIGFLLALALWFALAGPYTRLLASVSQAAIRLSEWPSITSIVPSGPAGTLMVVQRSDFPPSRDSMQLAVESTSITFNFILLVTLFAASKRVFSDRNVFGLFAASAILVGVHVAAVISFIKADYALNYGAWSSAHYGAIARGFWGGAPYFYSVVGAHAFAFTLWWLFRDSASASTSPNARRAVPNRTVSSARGRRPRAARQH
jgi:hypothetical protein